MQPSSSSLLPAATRMGEAARLSLASGREGKVLAVVSKAIYLLDGEELFWITTADAPMHRRSAVVSGGLPQVTTGALYRVESNHLIFNSYSLEIGSASVWRAPRPGRTIELDALRARVDSFFSCLDLSEVRGFGAFIPQILCLSRSEPAEPLPEAAEEILLFAQSLVLDLARACLEHDHSRMIGSANALVGLGAGLTPSGDDFLGEACFALRVLHNAFPDLDLVRLQPRAEAYASHTNRISHTLLKDLALGHAIGPLHWIVNSLLREGPLYEMDPLTDELRRLGHSTGWDLLAGLLAGFLSIYMPWHSISSLRLTQAVQD